MRSRATASKRSSIPRRLAILASAALVTGSLAFTGIALAAGTGVQDNGIFQLEGDSLASPTNNCTLPTDWSALYLAGGKTPCSSDGFSFVPDGVGSADHTYWSGGGSKDAYDPALGPWLWAPNDVSPDKNDIVNAFAAAYHTGSGSTAKRFLYFGADRYNTNGDAQMGFQFLQAPTCLAGTISGITAGGTAACPSTTPNQVANAGKFVDPTTGNPVHHMNGDLLVLVNFNNGGSLGLAGVFAWSGADGAGAGSYGQVLFGNSADCKTIADPNNFCSTASTASLTGDPVWPYTAKGVTGQATYGASSFIEGGVNLSAIQGSGSCFPSFIAETRSSAGPSSGLGLTAQLKDLAFGSFELCGSALKTTPKLGDGSSIPSGGVSIGAGSVSVKDSAQLDVTGFTWSGTFDFYLCGPSATAGTCTSSNGTHIGSTLSIDQNTTIPIVSDAASVTSAGTYCWSGVFKSSTTGVPSKTDNSAGECFTVNPVQPSLSTTASTTVAVGQTISDTAHLSGTTSEPGSPVINPSTQGGSAGGSITFTLYGPDSCSTKAWTSSAVPVTGDGDYSSGTFTALAAGTYHWAASYTGDSPNTKSASGATVCTDTHEDVVVTPFQPSIVTTATPGPVALGNPISDSAVLSGTTVEPDGTTPAQGSITFKLYSDSTCSTLVTTLGPIAVNGDSTYGSGDYTPTAAGTFYWTASYTGDAPNTLGASEACGGTGESSVVISLQPTISTAQSFVPNDSATITVAAGGGNLAGNVDFQLFVNDVRTCTGTPAYDSGPVAVSGALTKTVSSSNTTAYSASGSTTFNWLVTYTSTNQSHKNVTSTCTNETSSISINNGTTLP